MSYTTKGKVDALFGVSIPQQQFDDIHNAVKVYIDKYCGKTFEAASETRIYDGNGKETLNVDSFVGTAIVTMLKENGDDDVILTEGQGGDYVVAPYNFTEKNQIILMPGGRYSSFPERYRAVKIEATFGQSITVPADIQLAATKLVGDAFTNPATDQKTGETLGDYSVQFGAVTDKTDKLGVTKILDMYRDIDI